MGTANRRPAEVFPPGEFVRDELEARGWTQADLAEILGRPVQLVNEVIAGKRSVTLETARGLGEAFGTGPELWLNLENSYQLWRDPPTADTSSIARRAKIYAKAPVKDMVRRGWIESSGNVAVLEKRILDYFEIGSLDEEPTIWAHAARKSTSYTSLSPAQCAWMIRATKLARGIAAESFNDRHYKEALTRLRAVLHSAEEIRHVPRILAEAGIRLLVVEPIPKVLIDGVTFWLDEHSPVIALSLRYDRIDWFWQTILHEIKHIENRDGLERPGAIDILFANNADSIKEKPEYEKEIDRLAADFLIPEAKLLRFISRTRPLYSKLKIKGFAAVEKVHPGIVVGQLQFRGEISYAHNREMLAKVRDILTESALTDGWGKTAPQL